MELPRRALVSVEMLTSLVPRARRECITKAVWGAPHQSAVPRTVEQVATPVLFQVEALLVLELVPQATRRSTAAPEVAD
jgi:hypothetical protein